MKYPHLNTTETSTVIVQGGHSLHFVISHTSRYNNSTRQREVDSTAQDMALLYYKKTVTSEIEFHTFQFPIPSRSFIFLFCYCWIIDALFDQLVLINAINVNGDINAPKSKLLTFDEKQSFGLKRQTNPQITSVEIQQ